MERTRGVDRNCVGAQRAAPSQREPPCALELEFQYRFALNSYRLELPIF